MKLIFWPILTGLLCALAHPKANLFPLAFVGLLPWFWALKKGLSGFIGGWIAGFSYFMPLLYWLVPVMTHFGGLPPLAAWGVLALLALYLALYWALVSTLIQRHGLLEGDLAALLVPAVWVAGEFLRGKLFYGFPWGFLGASQARFLPFIQIADLGGIYAVSFLVVLANVGLFLFWERRFKGAIISFILIALCLGYGLIRLHTRWPEEKTQVFGLVQGNIPQDLKWSPALKEESLTRYLKLSEEALGCGAEVVLWPETALPWFFPDDTLSRRVLSWSQKHPVPLVLGAPRLSVSDEKIKVFNSLFLLKGGKILGIYDKQQLVPFGEFVPLERYFPLMRTFAVAAGNFSPGLKGAPLSLGPERHLGPLICFESTFPSLARRQVRQGANILLVATNDAWFGRSAGPYQHFDQAVFRAVETRRYVVRVANTGISGIIDPYGRILKATPLEKTVASCMKGAYLSYFSYYTRLGDVWAGICVFISIALAMVLFPFRKGRRNLLQEK